jgi:hypothetical protein
MSFMTIGRWVIGPWVKGSEAPWAHRDPCPVCTLEPPHIHALRDDGSFGVAMLTTDQACVEGPEL